MARKKSTSPEAPVYYTTHQAAKHLGVSLPTIVNWVNAGLLRAHRTPGGHRRIAHQDMIEFAQIHNYPLAEPLLAREISSKRILIVDSDRDFSQMLREYLAARGEFEVVVASSGFWAGVAIASARPDLVLLDPRMPDIDPVELRKALGDSQERTAIIAIAGHRDPENERRLLEQPFDRILEKPLKLDVLLDIVRALIAP